MRRSRESPAIDPSARLSLGRRSPELAWQHVLVLCQQAVEKDPAESSQLCRQYDLKGEPEELLPLLRQWNPVRGLNQLHEMNPKLPLRNLLKQPPLEVLEAVLHFLLNRER